MEDLIYTSIDSTEYKEDISRLYHIYFDLFIMNELRLSTLDNPGGKLLKFLTLYEEHLLLTEKIMTYHDQLDTKGLVDEDVLNNKKEISELLNPTGDNYTLMSYLSTFLSKIDELDEVVESKEGLNKYKKWLEFIYATDFISTHDIIQSYYKFVD